LIQNGTLYEYDTIASNYLQSDLLSCQSGFPLCILAFVFHTKNNVYVSAFYSLEVFHSQQGWLIEMNCRVVYLVPNL